MSKKLVAILFACFISLYLDAEPIESESKIEDVVVYRTGVRITRNARINLPAGQSEILFSNLTTQINTHSLQVQVPEGIDLVAAQYKTDYLKNIELPENVKKINEEMAALNLEQEWNNNELAVYTKEEQLITINKQFDLRLSLIHI